MNRIRAIFLTLIISLLSIFAVAQPAHAVDVLPVCSSGGANNLSSTHVCQDVNSGGTTSSNTGVGIIKRVITIVSYALGIVAVIMLIISGLRLITGGGDPNTVSSARNAIIYAVVGIGVAISAQLIVILVLNRIP